MTQQARMDSELWRDFHRIVNMSTQELFRWLCSCTAEDAIDPPTDGGDVQTGKKILEILQKRQADLNVDDEHIMRSVVDKVYAEHGYGGEPSAGNGDWRHRLMSLGHDPIRTWRTEGVRNETC